MSGYGYGPSLSDQGLGPEDAPEPKMLIGAHTSLELWTEFFDEDGYGEMSSCPDSRLVKRFTLKEYIEFEQDLQRFIDKWSGDPYRSMWVLRVLKRLEDLEMVT